MFSSDVDISKLTSVSNDGIQKLNHIFNMYIIFQLVLISCGSDKFD